MNHELNPNSPFMQSLDRKIAASKARGEAAKQYAPPGYVRTSTGGIGLAGTSATAKQKVAAVDDGWIKWEGGESPVRPHAYVSVRLRSDEEIEAHAWAFRWGHQNGPGDIVAYRVLFP